GALTSFNAVATSTGVTLTWTCSLGTNIAGYKVYYGVASRIYTNAISVGNVTNAAVTGLPIGATYFFAVTSYTTSGLESDFSTESSYTISPAGSLPTIVLTSPANGTSYTAPASISLAATVTANAHTI